MTDERRELIWRKSRSCASNACVEIARDGARFLVRDSTEPDGAKLTFFVRDWSSFLDALRAQNGIG